MIIRKQILLIFSATSLVLSGCVKELADPRVTAKPVEKVEDVIEEIEEKVVETKEKSEVNNVVVFDDIDAGEISFTKVSVPENPVDINIQSEVPFSYILESVASDWGWSVQYGQGVDRNIEVSVQVSNMELTDAMEDIAGLAGYTVVLDKKSRRCTVANRATWTFLLPANISDTLEWSYSVGGTPESQAGDAEGGGGLSSESTISGSNAVTTVDVVGFIEQSINGTAIEGQSAAIVTNMSHIGVVMVEGTYSQLKRAEKLFTYLVEEASTRVEVDVAVVDIRLDNEQSLGFNWQAILDNTGAGIVPDASEFIGYNFDGFGNARSGNLNLSLSTGSVDVILEAMRTMTEYSVISRPNMVVDNHTPADISDSTSKAYLSSIKREEDDNKITTTYEISSATEGLKISVLPHVLPGREIIQLKVVPYFGEADLTTNTLEIGDDDVSLPVVTSKQGFFSATIRSGETIVLAGIRRDKQSSQEKGLPFVSTPVTDYGADEVEVRELAYIINTRVIDPPEIDVVVDKSL